jgi:hypothetical protein
MIRRRAVLAEKIKLAGFSSFSSIPLAIDALLIISIVPFVQEL